MRKYTTILLACCSFFMMAATAIAATDYKNILNLPEGATQVKGGGGSFSDYQEWSPVFSFGVAEDAVDGVTYWRFLDSGTNANTLPTATEMKLLFNENDVFEWTAGQGFSTNNGGNNPGWVLKTPIGWVLTDGYLLSALNQFNLGGYTSVPAKEAPKGSLEVNAVSTLTTLTETWKEIWQGEKTPYKYVSQSYGGVTATNIDYKDYLTFDKKNNPQGMNIVPNSNHFAYAKLAVADLEEGVELAMVTGNKVEQVGTAFVQEIDGKIVITNFHSGEFGAVAYSALPEPKNGNIHSQKDFAHNSKSVIDLPDADEDGFVYLYIHGSFQFDVTDKNAEGYEDGYIWEITPPEKVGEEFVCGSTNTESLSLDVLATVFNAEGTEVGSFTLNNSSSTIDKLAPGDYTVKYSWSYDGEDYSDEGTTTVEENKTVSFAVPHIEYTAPVVKIIDDEARENLDDVINPVKTVTETKKK